MIMLMNGNDLQHTITVAPCQRKRRAAMISMMLAHLHQGRFVCFLAISQRLTGIKRGTCFLSFPHGVVKVFGSVSGAARC